MVTLHVGAGTFQPLRSEALDDHVMHAEWYAVPAATVEAIGACPRGRRARDRGRHHGGALAGVGGARTLRAGSGDTALFIRPGFRFRVVDGLVTNFHLPGSTLLMLVAAYAGLEPVLAAYRHAVEQRYRFFSYGDAMLIWPAAGVRA